jgi:hypothetical protein
VCYKLGWRDVVMLEDGKNLMMLLDVTYNLSLGQDISADLANFGNKPPTSIRLCSTTIVSTWHAITYKNKIWT